MTSNLDRRIAVAKAGRPAQPKARTLAQAQAVAKAIPLADRSDDGADLKRILALPVIPPLNEEELEAFRVEHTLESAYNREVRPFRWNKEQAEAILAWQQTRGMFGPLQVGSGKTLILQYIASLAYREGWANRICLILPVGLVDQFLDYDLKFARQNVPFNVPVHSFAGMNPAKRRAFMAGPRRKGLYLLPYSLLSRENCSTLLFDIEPQLLLVDEAYYLRDPDSVVTKRVNRYRKASGCGFVGVAGSISDKKIEDYAHIVEWCLKDKSPLPRGMGMLTAWSQVVSTGAQPPTGSTILTVGPLLNWARENFPEENVAPDVSGFRKAYRLRFQSAPGVAASDAESLGVSLTYTNVPVSGFEDTIDTEKDCPGWRKLCGLIDQLDPGIRGAEGPKLWLTPDGEQIDHAIHTFNWAYQLSAGIYYSLVWPEPGPYAKRRRLSLEEAGEFIRLGQDHQKATQTYHRQLRAWLERHPDALGSRGQPIDSPLLVGQEMFLSGRRYVSADLYDCWKDKKEKEFPGMAIRDQKPVRVCPWKVNHAVEWAKSLPKGEGSIIWFWHKEVGRWVHEALVEAGLPALWCGAGMGGALRDPASGDKHCVSSIFAHHKGLNLQYHHWNVMYIQWPRSSIHCEQTVGRVHRQGQVKDALTMHSMNTLPFDHKVLAASRVDALYQHETGAGKQKLIYGRFVPEPVYVDPAVLRAAGLYEGKVPGLDQARTYFKGKAAEEDK